MKFSRFLFPLFLSLYFLATSFGQVTLNADGETDTYELINSVLAPNYNVIETPDCIHKEVKHIDQVFDEELNKYVFRFLAHKFPDNDRCKNFDRQRTEIKTYDKSPDNLKATLGEKVEYKWRFKIESTFQPSSKFTHLHQIKAVGGPHDAMPLICLTARKSSPDRLELRYGEETSQITLDEIPLDELRGEWIEAKEIILFQDKSFSIYQIELVRMKDDFTVFSYESTSLKMWKTDADFLRPKWGIYRSLLDSNSLKDEDVLFSDFSIEEIYTSSTNEFSRIPNFFYPNPVNNRLLITPSALSTYDRVNIVETSGRKVLEAQLNHLNLDLSSLPKGVYIAVFNSSSSSHTTRQVLIKE